MEGTAALLDEERPASVKLLAGPLSDEGWIRGILAVSVEHYRGGDCSFKAEFIS